MRVSDVNPESSGIFMTLSAVLQKPLDVLVLIWLAPLDFATRHREVGDRMRTMA